MPLWSAPKTNWATTDGIANTDLNRGEQNTEDLRDAVFRKVQGFGYISGAGLDYLKIQAGSCFSSDFYPLNFAGGIKALTSHSAGFGSTIGGLAPTVTVAANTWYYIFALGHSTSADVEIMIDSSPTGANVTLTNYPYKRFVNSFRTDSASKVAEMYSTGDRVFINPNSFHADREITIAVTHAEEHLYVTRTLDYGSGNYATPARDVRARLNIRHLDDDMSVNLDALGLYSRITDVSGSGLCLTIPSQFVESPTTPYDAEVLFLCTSADTAANFDKTICDCELMINSSRQFSMGVTYNESLDTEVLVAVRGYYDTREI